jgi:hypothetical protein
MAFVDFTTAFDLVRRDLLVGALDARGIHGTMLQSITNMYDRVVVRAKVNGQLGPEICTGRGTK